VLLIVQAVIAVALAWGVGQVLALIHPWAAWIARRAGGDPWVVLEWFRRKDNKFFAYYLMHDYAYSAQHLGADPPELRRAWPSSRMKIAEALRRMWTRCWWSAIPRARISRCRCWPT
jgi:hypothetical protein